MRMNNQGQAHIPKRQFSNAQMKRYFTEKRYSGKTVIFVSLIGFIAFGSCAFSTNVAVFGVMAFIIGGIYILVRAKLIPTDREYDEWLERRARSMAYRARKKLDLDRSQMISPPLRVDSFVLPGSQAAAYYPAHEVYMKKGKDDRWRFSVNVFTYFFAAENYLAVFSGGVNALNQSAPPIEETEEYFYDDIVGVTTYTTQDYADINGYQYLYRIQKFSLRIVNGDDIDLGAYIRATAIGSNQSGPAVIPPTMNIDRVLADLRTLLRYKRQKSF